MTGSGKWATWNKSEPRTENRKIEIQRICFFF